MAFAAVNNSNLPLPHSIGPVKEQIMSWSCVSGDTSGTVTVDGLNRAETILIDGLQLTAAPTFSGNVVTLAFADPVASVFGTLIVHGR
jgi:hypothetical protein